MWDGEGGLSLGRGLGNKVFRVFSNACVFAWNIARGVGGRIASTSGLKLICVYRFWISNFFIQARGWVWRKKLQRGWANRKFGVSLGSGHGLVYWLNFSGLGKGELAPGSLMIINYTRLDKIE